MFEDLIPELQGPAQDLLDAAGASGLQPRVTSTRRTHQAQVRLYRRWLSGASPLPAAPPGTSAHEYGFAFDMVVSPYEALADVGYTWVTWGGEWGGDRDPVHFQYPGFVVPQSQTLAEQAGTGWLANLVAGLPIAFWPSVVFEALGIPSVAKKTVTPDQEAYLRGLVKNLK